MDIISLPIPKIKARKIDLEVEKQAQLHGLHPLLARIIASRPKPNNYDIQQQLDPKLGSLDHPLTMRDMEKASIRLATAIIDKEVIGIETDHDCDGQTSHAVLYDALLNKFKVAPNLIRSYIGHRLTEGYGLSAKVAQRILEDQPRPSLLITADNGSADEARIALLKTVGIDVIVTDHHQLPLAGPPVSAYACINPTRNDCDYPDPYIAGCMVAWLLMVATRIELIKRGYLNSDAPKLTDSLDFVAVGTVADCVSMARSYNNRAIVTYGLKLINAGRRPCWRAIKVLTKGVVSAEDLGFKVGPLLNSDGRLASAFGSVSFLLAGDDPEAQQWIGYLQEQNQIRKGIQNSITQQGIKIAVEQTRLERFSLCIFLAGGHAGVHGISASRIKESFGRPTVFLAPKQGEDGILTGSIRSIEGFHVGNALEWIMQQDPTVLIAGGGHAGAGGVTLRSDNYERFTQLFETAAQQQLVSEALGPVVWTDGELTLDDFNIATLDMLTQLEPFGREFEAPVFEVTAVLESFRTIGDGSHARLELRVGQQRINGVWFSFQSTAAVGDTVRCAFSLKGNDFGGIRRCEIQVLWLATQP
jgi:single-stranded-DNA-specific exonuclease